MTSNRHSNPPGKCDTCGARIAEAFYDARMGSNGPILGAWANMCPSCFSHYGEGVGVGKGQKYVRGDDLGYRKVEG